MKPERNIPKLHVFSYGTRMPDDPVKRIALQLALAELTRQYPPLLKYATSIARKFVDEGELHQAHILLGESYIGVSARGGGKIFHPDGDHGFEYTVDYEEFMERLHSSLVCEYEPPRFSVMVGDFEIFIDEDGKVFIGNQERPIMTMSVLDEAFDTLRPGLYDVTPTRVKVGCITISRGFWIGTRNEWQKWVKEQS